MHGTLFIFALLYFFPDMVGIFVFVDYEVPRFQFPDSILLLIFMSLAFFWGQTIMALSSYFQWFLFLTWGGKPSDKVFSGSFPQKYLSDDLIKLAKEKLQSSFATPCSDSALFSKAKCIARKAEGSLSERHNQMYAYNRIAFLNILAISIIFLCSCYFGICEWIPMWCRCVLGIIFFLLLCIHWYRAKQRAFYYVSEVIIVAERELSGENRGVRN